VFASFTSCAAGRAWSPSGFTMVASRSVMATARTSSRGG
jgi:hypothetical protein